ncbi:MAG: agmatine deiminase family protein [Bacteroidota bacterium]
MNRTLIHLILAIILLGCTETAKVNTNTKFRIPGEFEPQEAIWLGFDSNREEGYFKEDTYKILRALNPNTDIYLVAEHDSLIPTGKMEFHEKGLDTSRIEIFIQEPTDAWYRDNGPIFGIDSVGELTILGFQNISEDLTENRKDVAQRMNIEYIQSDIVMEGGSFESNGRGTVILCEQVTLRQNPDLTKEQIENELRTKFDIETVIWMKRGVDPLGMFARITGDYFGRGTGGHTDEFVRFANDSTILFSWISEEEAEIHPVDSVLFSRLNTNFNILQGAKDHRGRRFKVIKVPHPDPDPESWIAEEEDERFGIMPGDSLFWLGARSYLNYVITNDMVLIPQYGEEDRSAAIREEDKRAKEIFEQVFPNREVIGIPLEELKWNGGGMHCRYQSQPKVM